MKSLVDLWTHIAAELAVWCCTSSERDSKRVSLRVEEEGESFLTLTLPTFGKAFEQGLAQGYIENATFLGFAKCGRGPLPRFLGGFLSQVFDKSDGSLLASPSSDAVYAIRQLCFLFAKIERPCTPERCKAAYDEYIEVEKEVEKWNSCCDEVLLQELNHVSTLLYSSVLSELDRMVHDQELIGAHGPGATAERLSSNGKYSLSVYPERLDREFPALDNVLPNPRYWEGLDTLNLVGPDQEIPSRVIQVPKTMKTPRIIAIEPAAMQFAQQAVSRPLVRNLESPVTPSGVNRSFGFLGFTDQLPNQELARQGSLSGDLATIDMSQASDRVSILHVEALLRNYPSLWAMVKACRSSKADVPGYGVVPLSKFASMGSALCFPMEAMVFLAVVLLGVSRDKGQILTPALIREYRGRIRVYGDDIIVPAGVVHSVKRELEAFGFRVNSAKSFWTGKFRESCGGDFFSGTDVTPVRLKRDFPRTHRDAAAIVSLVAFRNNLYKRGLWNVCHRLDTHIGKILQGHYPCVAETSPVLGRLTFLGYETQRMHPDRHSPLVKGYRVKNVIPVDHCDDVAALTKFLLKQGDKPLPKGHLQRSGRPQAVSIKLGWAQPF